MVISYLEYGSRGLSVPKSIPVYPFNKACRLIGLPIKGDNKMINKLIIGLSQTMADKIIWQTLHK